MRVPCCVRLIERTGIRKPSTRPTGLRRPEMLFGERSYFAVYECPVCHNWCLTGTELLDRIELNQIAREHLLECFGVPEEMAS